MKQFLSNVDWCGVTIALLVFVFIALIIGVGFFGHLILLPVLGYVWTLVVCVPLGVTITLVFLEILFRY